MTKLFQAVAVIVDVSKSRLHSDRSALQVTINEAFDLVNRLIPTEQPLEPTVGDEFQAAYNNVWQALRATLLARLHLPEGVDCRFGLGHGEIHTVGSSRVGLVQDGSAWWAAREAIEEARAREYSGLRFVRTWFAAAGDDSTTFENPTNSSDRQDTFLPELINAYLLSRDHLVSKMNARNRRLLLGQLLGKTQGELAKQEGISQSAVSQNLHRSGGAALLAGAELLEGASR